MHPPKSKRKQPPRFAKLDGKAPPKPRGRHAASSIKAMAAALTSLTPDDEPKCEEPKREVVSIPVTQRLGFRPGEFAALIGVSAPTVWRAIKRGDIPIVDQNGIKIIPRSYAVARGYLTDDTPQK